MTIGIGIDIATNTGLASAKVIDGEVIVKEHKTISATQKDKPLIEKAYIVSQLVIDEVRAIRKREHDIFVVIEGYGFARQANIEPVFTYGTMIRFALWQNDIAYLTVPPTSLKKFVTGKGNAPKDIMIKEVYKRWKFDTSDNNQADALGLACFGLAYRQLLTMPAVNTEAVEKVREGK